MAKKKKHHTTKRQTRRRQSMGGFNMKDGKNVLLAAVGAFAGKYAISLLPNLLSSTTSNADKYNPALKSAIVGIGGMLLYSSSKDQMIRSLGLGLGAVGGANVISALTGLGTVGDVPMIAAYNRMNTLNSGRNTLPSSSPQLSGQRTNFMSGLPMVAGMNNRTNR